MYRVYPRSRPEAPEVNLLYGPAGCGKTWKCTELSDDLWMTPVTDGLWFDGYDGQDDALLDDFSGKFSKMSLTNLLRVLDRYVVQVPIKGGFVQFAPKRIFITTNIHPRDWYDYSERETQYAAVKRRFTRVDTWRADGTDLRHAFRGTEEFNFFFDAYQSPGS